MTGLQQIAHQDHQTGLVRRVSNETGLVRHVSQPLEALSSAPVCRLPTVAIESILMSAVQKAFKDKGQQIAPDQADHLVSSLASAILKVCPYIRIAEVPIAIENGVLGEYGEYFGLNVVTFVSFVKSYFNSQNRAEMVKNWQKEASKETVANPPSEEEMVRRNKELLIKAFDRYKRLGYYEDYGNYVYQVAAKKFKLFSLSEDRKKEYLEQGKKRAIAHYKNEMTKRPFDRNVFAKNIEEAAGMVKGSEGLNKVYKEALQLALMGWFKELVEKEVEIKDLLNG